MGGGLQFSDWRKWFFKCSLCLRMAPVVKQGNVLHALNGAARRARLERAIFTLKMLRGVLFQRNARVPPLLGTIVNQTVFAHVKVAAAGTTTPFARNPAGNIFLMSVKA